MSKGRAFVVDDGFRIPIAVTAGRASTVTATDAKNEFGRVLEKVIRGGIVVITKHDEPKEVLISVREFNALTNATEFKLVL